MILVFFFLLLYIFVNPIFIFKINNFLNVIVLLLIFFFVFYTLTEN
jgi:hypothetical protein